MRATTGLLVLGAALAAGCGPATVRPTSYPDPEVPCPGGRSAWSLQIIDQRADQTASDRMVHDVRDAIQKSFPGCKWTTAEGGDSIVIEIHRLASRYSEGGWDAAAEWDVTVKDASGGTLTQFQANEEASSPNYSNRDNEKETLSEAFRKAVEKTAKGLRGVSAAENARPRRRTGEAEPVRTASARLDAKPLGLSDFSRTRRALRAGNAWNGSRTRESAEVL
jgi:hypothetical protein